MIAAQAFALSDLAPAGMGADDFYVLLTGLAAFAVVVLVGKSFVHRDDMGPRIKALQERRQTLKMDAVKAKRRQKSHQDSIGFMKRVVVGMKLLQRSQSSKITQDLITAGYRSRDAVYIFTFAKLVMPVMFIVLSFIVADISLGDPSAVPLWKWMIPPLAALLGYKFPDLLVANARGKRHHQIRRALADTLDLMLICAEAGLSLAATLDRVSRELAFSYEEMAEELSLTSIEMGFLPDRQKALHNLTERVQMPEIRGIVSVLLQTEKYGTPISQALRVLANEFRTQRMLRAEQKAARLPAIMTVPMILFILPTMFIVIISPAVIKIMAMSK